MFFFSSRRRHTRWPRDWSSDVCSSDLGYKAAMCGLAPVSVQLRREQGSAQGVGQSLFNKNVGKFSDEARVVGAEINHAVVFRASGELAGVFLGVSVDQHPLGIAYHSPADGHGLLGN